MSELKFNAAGHAYNSVHDPDRKWISVTTIIGMFKEPFDQILIATRCAKKKTSKWFGFTVDQIIGFWNNEADRANITGTWYHDQREKDVGLCETIRREGVDLPIFNPIEKDGIRYSPEQKLVPGIYPEHFVYLKSANICGQVDRAEIVNDVVNIYDYKTNKKIEKVSYVNWEGKSKRMYAPLQHVDDCNLMHYTLQMSIYMYIMLKHNHNLKPGKLVLQHVTFEIEDTDQFGFPKLARDIEGNPVISDMKDYEVPYMKKEVEAMIKYKKLNPKKFL